MLVSTLFLFEVLQVRKTAGLFPTASEGLELNIQEAGTYVTGPRINSVNTRIESLLNKSSGIFWGFLKKYFSDSMKKLKVRPSQLAHFDLAILAIYFSAEEVKRYRIPVLKSIFYPKPYDISGNIIHLYQLQNALIFARKNLKNITSHWENLSAEEFHAEYQEKSKAAEEALKNLINHLVAISIVNKEIGEKKNFIMAISVKIPDSKFVLWKTNLVWYHTTPLSENSASKHLAKKVQKRLISDEHLAMDQLSSAFCKDNQDELDSLMLKLRHINQKISEEVGPARMTILSTELALLIQKLQAEELEEKIKLLEDERPETQKTISTLSDRLSEKSREMQNAAFEEEMQELESTETPRRMFNL